ncbi:MAG: formylglycine-generating enzyme family protein, partial [Nannocystaceae bacterium]
VDEFGFMHLGFQEYMVAQAIRGRVFEEPERLRWLASRFGDGWWQEVILLLLAKGNPPMFKRFMSEVVARPDFVKWTATKMMGLCLAEAFGVSAAPFVELLRAQEDPDGTLEARQVVGFELLAQRMPSVVDGMEDLLREHPAELVRHRWRVWKRTTKGMEVVMAPRGGVELVRIPGGRFLMGSPEEEEAEMEDGNRYEGPQHEVALGDFYIARTPLTNVQYRKFLEDPERPKGVKEPEHWGDRNYNQDEQPVVGVSWDDAKAYCAWAGLVLPTEAQWEYACRAGTTTRHYSGDTEEDLAKVGWYQGNSGGQLHAVGELEPNEFGLYDMHGNVLEWCEDDWVDSYANAEHRAGDGLRVKPVGGADRVVRGGLFGGAARDARSAFRDRGAPVSRWYYVGFRPAQGHPFQA